MKRYNRVIPVLLVLVLIGLIGGSALLNVRESYESGTTDRLNFNLTYELEENEYMILLNREVQTFKAYLRDDALYLDVDHVCSLLNTRFYWDENERVLIYTKPTQIIKAKPGQSSYVADGSERSFSVMPIRMIDKNYCVALDYVKEFTQLDYEAFSDPNRLVITTKWGDQNVAMATQDTVVRYRGGPRSEIVTDVAENEQVYVIQMEDDWSWVNVVTKDGYIGWMEKDKLSDMRTEMAEAPSFREDQFTYMKEDGRICLAWHQMTTVNGSTQGALWQALNNTEGITIVGPTWFCFADTEGNVNSLATYEYVAYAHEVGVKVWAVMQNTMTPGGGMSGNQTDQILKYTSRREKLVEQLIAYALEYGIDGINLDFESILVDGADNYIQFVRELSVACRKNGLTFSVDNYTPIYTMHYNRAEQAVFADYLVIMGYDEYGDWSSEPGPVASIPFVKQGIEDTLELIGGDASKLINGIPFYVGIWETGPNNYLDYSTATMPTAAGYLQKYPDDTIGSWNDELGYYYAYYTSPINDLTYKIWLEDARSIEEKMRLVQRYKLAGVACWKLQQETAEVWPIINSYLQY